MTIKRIAFVGILATTLTLAACSSGEVADPTTAPSPSESVTPSPTPSVVAYEPPATEEEAVTAAKATIELILDAQSEINAAGGEGAERYDDLAMGNGLDTYKSDAARIASGPLLNEDGENIDGQSTTEGRLTFEAKAAYGQEFDGVQNGLVLVPGCLDGTGYKITTADGKPAYRPDDVRTKIEYQVTYDADRKQWLVSDQIAFMGEPC